MRDDQPGDVQELPCGCRMYVVGKALVFEPHSEDCYYYQYAVAEAQRRDKPIQYYEI